MYEKCLRILLYAQCLAYSDELGLLIQDVSSIFCRLYLETELLGIRQDVQITNGSNGGLAINQSLGSLYK